MREFEITHFKGRATDRNNWTKEQCQICKNFDLREVKGRLTSRAGYVRKYVSPGTPGDLSTNTILRMENIVMTAGGVEKECTVLVGQGTLDRVGDSAIATESIKIGTFFIQPYYLDGAWTDDDSWLWLNECYLTKITGQVNNRFDLFGDFDATGDYFKKFSIYSIATAGGTPTSIYSEIYNSDYISGTKTEIYLTSSPSTDEINLGDNHQVLVMRNFIPYADLLEYGRTTGDSPITASDISFHKIPQSVEGL